MAPHSRRFSKRIDSLVDIFSFTEGFFAREGVGPSDRYSVNFAVEELFTNMVKYNPESDHDIELSIEREDDRIRIQIIDSDVQPFHPGQAPEADTDVPLARRTPGGLGIHLLKKMMDSVDYRYEDRRSTITLVKTLGCSDV